MVLIEISQGSLKGAQVTSECGVTYYEFLGVPYAKPPIGNLRFKSPERLQKWNGIFDATAYKEHQVCAQIFLTRNIFVGSEDCLYLNVFTPRLPEFNSKPLPVMVFIHGGAFVGGNGINKGEIGPQYLVEKDVVVVSINYRVGVLGFLCLDTPEVPGNMGLKDQVQALKWVQENIDKFGGDRHNVTIFGISAGSASVEYHILSPLSKGLFHKAILQSGSALNAWAINYESDKILLKLLEKMGYDGSTENKEAIFEYLASSSLNELIQKATEATRELTNIITFFGFVPTIEKDFGDGNAMITERPYKLLKEGRFNRVPIIAGACGREGYLKLILQPQEVRDVSEKKNFADYWPYEVDDEYKNIVNGKLLSAYSQNTDGCDEVDRVGIEFFSDFDFAAGSYLRGELMAKNGVPVYLYEFCYDGKINFCKCYFKIKTKSAAHGDDTTYIFKHDEISKCADEKDVAVREMLTKMWTNFAKSSDPTPNKELNISWPTYNTSQSCLIIDEIPKIQSNYRPNRMEAFKIMYDKYEM